MRIFSKRFWVLLLSAGLLATGANLTVAPAAMGAVQETSMDRYYDLGASSWANNEGREELDGEAFTLTNNSTVEFWANIPSGQASSWIDLMGKENSWVFAHGTDGNFLWAYMGPTGWNWLNSGVYMKTDTWMHIAVRNSGRYVYLYFDGVLVSSGDTWYNAADKTFTGAPTDSNGSFGIGGRTNMRNNNYYYGHNRNGTYKVDEIKVYKSDRSANLLSDMHTRADVTDPALTAYYDFNEIGASIKNQKSLATNESDLKINNFEGTSVNRKDVKTVTRPDTRQGKTVVTFPRTYITKEGGWVVPTGLGQVEVLQVAGGGAGGARHAGGGGAGGYYYRPAVNVIPGQTLKVQVGQGGVSTKWYTWNAIGTKGQDTFFGTARTLGGGTSGAGLASSDLAGGSGAGATGSGSAGTSNQNSTAGYGIGNPGGLGSNGTTSSNNWTGGGGGGAGTSGGNSSVIGSNAGSPNAGNGGRGLVSTITGASVCYAAGGGGGVHATGGAAGAGGSCVETNTTVGGPGGRGRTTPLGSVALNGVTNSGSGGGGTGWDEAQVDSVESGIGGDGGSGVVVITYSNNVPLAMNNGCDTYQYETGAYTIEEVRRTGACNWTVPSGVSAVDLLVVGGGGGGGAHVAGGGGAGGVYQKTNFAVSAGEVIPVEVGAGGAGAQWSPRLYGENGGQSKFGTFAVLGGGRGASWNWSNANGTGASGTSVLATVANGGGGTWAGGPGGATASALGAGFSGGNAGGAGSIYNAEPHPAGGGGGAGGAGQAASGQFLAGKGGPGVATTIRGYTEYVGGGGGGGTNYSADNIPDLTGWTRGGCGLYSESAISGKQACSTAQLPVGGSSRTGGASVNIPNAGGGGGAGGAGGSAIYVGYPKNYGGGTGGAGSITKITGSALCLAGGGSGGSLFDTKTAGESSWRPSATCGGGTGSRGPLYNPYLGITQITNAASGSGGGGGGAGAYMPLTGDQILVSPSAAEGGRGGSGVIIIRFTVPNPRGATQSLNMACHGFSSSTTTEQSRSAGYFGTAFTTDSTTSEFTFESLGYNSMFGHEWGAGGPTGCGTSGDYYTVYAWGYLQNPTGTQQNIYFEKQADDGFRLVVDGKVFFDEDTQYTTVSNNATFISMKPGSWHFIQLWKHEVINSSSLGIRYKTSSGGSLSVISSSYLSRYVPRSITSSTIPISTRYNETLTVSMTVDTSTEVIGGVNDSSTVMSMKGKYTFYDSQTALTGCVNVYSSNGAFKCSWYVRPSAVGYRTIKVVFTPDSSTAMTDLQYNVFRRVEWTQTIEVTKGRQSPLRIGQYTAFIGISSYPLNVYPDTSIYPKVGTTYTRSVTTGTAGCQLDPTRFFVTDTLPDTSTGGSCVATVVLSGTELFAPETGTATIYFVKWSDAYATQVPSGAHTIPLNGGTQIIVHTETVTVTDTATAFRDLSNNVITSAAPGDEIRIYITGYAGLTAADLSVTFRVYEDATITAKTDTYVQVLVPSTASSGVVAIDSPRGVSYTPSLTISP